jgi:4-amino-4-deoxy-L-arabinose transferase-like glycosyltransferase
MSRRAWLVLALAAALRAACLAGPWTDDAHGYAERSHDLSRGTFRPWWWNASDFRIGLLAPTAALYRLFGINALTSAAVPFAASMAIVALTWAVVRPDFGERAATLAALTAALFPLDVQYAGTLMTDLPAAAMMALALWLWRRGWPAAAGLALGGAHLFRETAFFALAVMAAHAWARRDRAILRAALAFVVVVGLESTVYAAWLDSPLARWIPATQGLHHTLMERHGSDPAWTARRLLWTLPSLLFNPTDYQWPYFGLTGPALIAALVLWRRMRFFVAWTGLMLLLVNFWPNQLWPYRPGSYGWGRELAVIIIPASAMIGTAAAALWDRRLVRAGAATLWIAHAGLNLVCTAHFREWRSALDGVEPVLRSRPEAPVLSDLMSARELSMRLQYRRKVLDTREAEPAPGTLVVFNEMYERFIQSVHPGKIPPLGVEPHWRRLHERTHAAPLHGRRIRLIGGPEPLKATEYRVAVYEVP